MQTYQLIRKEIKTRYTTVIWNKGGDRIESLGFIKNNQSPTSQPRPIDSHITNHLGTQTPKNIGIYARSPKLKQSFALGVAKVRNKMGFQKEHVVGPTIALI